MTIRGNGTFIPPGILVIDWKVLSAPTSKVYTHNCVPKIHYLYHFIILNPESDRLVFTILGANPSSWVVGYMCRNGAPNRKCDSSDDNILSRYCVKSIFSYFHKKSSNCSANKKEEYL